MMNSSNIINRRQVEELSKRKGLVPSKVIGSEQVQLSKGSNKHLATITWDEFFEILEKRNLAVYSLGGWMKIMQKR